MGNKGLLGMVAAAMLFVGPGPSQALDTLRFNMTGRDVEDLEKDLRAVSVLQQLETSGEDAPRDVVTAAQGDYARLVEALYAKGYYSATVRILIDGREAAQIDPFAVPAQISDVLVQVDPGRRFKFGETRIGPLAPAGVPPEAFRKGEPALATVVRDAAQGAVGDWRDEGHAKAAVSGQDIVARHPDARLDVAVQLSPGPRVTFGDVIVASESTVRDARIRQIAGIPRGELFMPADVEKAAERLRRTGTFRSVQVIESDTVAEDGSMDMRIEVVDAPPRRIGAGVEYSTFDGLTLSGFWLHRNVFGGAERLRIEGEVTQLGGQGVSGVDYTLTARGEKPAVYGPDTLFYIQGTLEYADEPDFLEERAEIALGFSREFSETLTADLGLAFSRSRITQRFLPRLPDGEFPMQELTLVSLPGALTWDRRDDRLDPTGGFYLKAELEPFTAVNTDINGGRIDVDARGYYGLGAEDRVVLAGRLQLGSLIGPEAEDAPPGYLYYSGGGGTVRGQPFESLDVDYGTINLGGRSFLGLSGELRVGVTDTISAVAFADAGYVGGESVYDGSGNWHSGAGLGLRYATPVGPIRVDVAGPLSGDTSDGVQLYIGIGQAF